MSSCKCWVGGHFDLFVVLVTVVLHRVFVHVKEITEDKLDAKKYPFIASNGDHNIVSSGLRLVRY